MPPFKSLSALYRTLYFSVLVASGVGAKYTWKGHPKKVGHGVMEIVDITDNANVKSLLQFGGRGDAYVNLKIEKR
mgnify:CR=1 FL=1